MSTGESKISLSSSSDMRFENFTGTRVTIYAKTPFETVISNMRSLVPPVPPSFRQQRDRASFEALIRSNVGKHDFVMFTEFNHGGWMRLFAPPALPTDGTTPSNKSRGLHRFVIGNPLIALHILREDVNAGLSVPVEILFVEQEESEGGGTRCVCLLPSGLIAGFEGARENKSLVEKVGELEKKIFELIHEAMGSQ